LPNYYAQMEKDGRIFAVSELAGEVNADDLIPITEEQYRDRRLLFTRYVNGEFCGVFAEIHSDKISIRPDGQEAMTVTISVTDWQGTLQKDYSEELIVELGGMRQTIKPVKGIAEFTISSDEPGEFMMRTIDLDRNAQLKVVVTDAN